MYFQIAVKKVESFFVITIFTCDYNIAYQLFEDLRKFAILVILIQTLVCNS